MKDRIKALMRDFNPWWEGKMPALPAYKRHIFADIQKYFKPKQIIAIVGLRRVGKTVLMKQIISELDAVRENILYFMFDEVVAQNPDILEDILDHYLKTIAKDGRKYIFLDEIQKVPYWQDILKRFYDTMDDIKFFVSGSASLQIKKSKESLAGRIFDFYLPILTFREFLELNSFSMEKADISNLGKAYEKNINKIAFIGEMFLKYIFRGAFPELAAQEDEDFIRNYIRSSVIEKMIIEDIPSVFPVRKKDVLSDVFEYCAKETGNLLNITSLANIVGTNYHTVRSYVFYLKNSFVIDLIYNRSKGASRQLRKNKKVHIAHPAITLSMTGLRSDILMAPEVVSRYVETIIFQHAKCLSETVSFWRTPQKEEIDIIMETDDVLPVEVKYQSQITNSDMKHLLKFLDNANLKKGMLITRDRFGIHEKDGKAIHMVPAWLFLVCI